jgi:plastocyanin
MWGRTLVKAIRYAVVCLSLLAVMACSKKTDEKPSADQEATPTAQIDQSTVGSVTGTVKFTGYVPPAQPIDMAQDAACKGSNTAETYIVDNGNLANAVVYIKDGLANYAYPSVGDAATVDQDGCKYIPHVLAIRTGQPVKFLNSDPTSHNVHPTPDKNEEWNESQQPKGEPITKQFSQPELMMPVKCNQHPWMKMHLSVFKHPYFAVTGKDGKFELKGLPPGTYTVAVVHEKLGEKTQQVTIGPKESKSTDFTYASQ